MKCADCQLLIDEIGDLDRLPSDAARHVAGCTACERFGVDLIALRRLLREPARVSAPESFDVQLQRRIRAARSAPPSRFAALVAFRPQTSLVAAAAFLLVCSGALVVSRYAMSPGTASSPAGIVAANRAQPAPDSAAGIGIPAPMDSEDRAAAMPGPVAIAQTGALRQVSASRPRATVRRAGARDAMLLVSDDGGTRLVNVPQVLVGAELIVPEGPEPSGDADVVAF